LESDTFDVLNTAQELVEGDVALLEAGDLCADTVVSNGTVNDIIVMECETLWLGAVVINKVRPILRVALKTFISEL
jgi:hypothetical protein